MTNFKIVQAQLEIPAIGPSFPDELEAAGILTLPIAWGDDGQINTTGLTEEQFASLITVAKAHDPNKGK